MALGEEGFHAISQGPLFAKCHVYGTRRSLVFAKCQTEALGEADGKGWGWMPSGFAKCLSSPSAWHLAKPSSPSAGFAKSQALGEAFFTKCPIFGTRRTLGHLAKPGFPVVYGQAFVVSEDQKLDWADMLYLQVHPSESRDMRFWPTRPASFG